MTGEPDRSPFDVADRVEQLSDSLPPIDDRGSSTEAGIRGFAQRASDLGLTGLITDGTALLARRIGVAMDATERLVAHSASLAMLVGAARIQTVMLLQSRATPPRNLWLQAVIDGSKLGSIAVSEAQAGSDVRGMTAVFHPGRHGGGVLDAEKKWVAVAPFADFSLVLAKVGSMSRDAETALILVERTMPGVTFRQGPDLMTYADLPMGEITCREVEVDADHVLHSTAGLRAFLEVVGYARLEAASHGVGLLRACLDELVTHVRHRIAFGVPLSGLQGVQEQVGHLRIDLEAASALRDRGVDAFARGEPSWQLCSAAKVFATDAAAWHTTKAMSLFGAAGLVRGSRIETLFRDCKAAQVFDGTSAVLKTGLGRTTLKE
jgi:alkylation response protein AidB-like acyl-CoA dehydrogenase